MQRLTFLQRQTLEDLDLDRSESSSQLLLETKCEPAVAGGPGPRILLKAVKFDMLCSRRLVPKWVRFSSDDAAGAGGGQFGVHRSELCCFTCS
jgi:hypothetical protein